MKIEEQVVSLEHAKKLKELGVEQASHFKWYYPETPRVSKALRMPDIAATFTVAELGEMLPAFFQTERRLSGDWECSQTAIRKCQAMNGKILLESFEEVAVAFFEKIEANARAKMLIYLIENKLLSQTK